MRSAAFLSKIFQHLRASYWFLPSLLVLAAILLAVLMEWIDHNTDLLPVSLPDNLLRTQIDDARATLSVVAQSVIGVTGVMFSMTIVAVSFASGKYGPRLIGNFMRDRGTQWSLGILIATFVYALLTLRSLHGATTSGADAFVPQYSIIMAMLLAILSVFTTIFFIHHIPELINVSNITASLGRKLSAALRQLIEDQRDRQKGEVLASPNRPPTATLALEKTGYVQALNITLLKEMAEENEWIVSVLAPPGAFVTEHGDALELWANTAPDAQSREKLAGCFAIGDSRTETQNILFLVDQLVEMIARALSPGVNDPFTAIDCLNWLHSGLQTAQRHEGGLRAVANGRVRIAGITLATLLEASFGACRSYVECDRLTSNHYQMLLSELENADLSPETREVIDRITIKTG